MPCATPAGMIITFGFHVAPVHRVGGAPIQRPAGAVAEGGDAAGDAG